MQGEEREIEIVCVYNGYLHFRNHMLLGLLGGSKHPAWSKRKKFVITMPHASRRCQFNKY